MFRRATLSLCVVGLALAPSTPAQARSEALDILGLVSLGVSTLGPPIGLGISLQRGERVADTQLVGGYMFAVADLALGLWVAADSQFGSPAQRAGIAVPTLAIAALTLPLTIYAHRRRPATDAPVPPNWGDVVDGIIRNVGLMVGSVAFVANGDSKAWLLGTGLAAFGLVLDIRRAVGLSAASRPALFTLGPQLFGSAGGAVAFGAMLRFAPF